MRPSGEGHPNAKARATAVASVKGSYESTRPSRPVGTVGNYFGLENHAA